MTEKRTLKQKLVAVQEAHIAEETTEEMERRAAVSRDSLLMVLGGIRAVHSVSEALNAQSIRALQLIRDEGLYKAEGYTRFDDFLNQSPLSPMKYDKFNYIEKALLSEGDELFNYLNAINAPMAQRRLLGKGSLAVEGEEIVIRADGDEQRIPVSDRAVLLTTLSKLADQTSEQRRTIERGKKENERLREKLIAAEQPQADAEEPTPFVAASLAAFAGLSHLARAARQLSPGERATRRTETLTMLDALRDEMRAAFDIQIERDPQQTARGSGLTDNITEADLESLM